MLEDKLREEMIQARKTGETAKVSALQLLLSAIHNEQIAQKKALTNAEVEKVLVQEAKKRKEAIEAFKAGGRPEKAEAEETELKIIEAYLPEPMGEEEIIKIVEEVISASSPNVPLGVIMGQVMQKVAGRAEGSMVARIVQEKLKNRE